MDAKMHVLFGRETCDWFEASVGAPTPVQQAGWPVIAEGKSVLISAPTGTGKTLTAFLMMIDRLNGLAKTGQLEDKLYCIYISPLKALGNDIRENLKRPIEGIGAPIRTAVRNGDTTPEERQKMTRKPPHILITTPESLYLLLTSKSGRKMIRTTETVIIDELHAVLGDKRGTHLLVSLTRLDELCGKKLQRIGLSATIRPLEKAADFLAGPDTAIAAPEIEKKTDVKVLAAAEDFARLKNHSIWPDICAEIYEASQHERTVLVFCEGRATAEKVAFGINELGGEGYARTHHGSMDKDRRLEAERALKSGELKVLCATSSMELGIDVGEVDLVVQVGCPQKIASAVQRLGRAGHRPGEISRMRFYPRMNSEMLLAAMTAEGMNEGAIETLEPPEMCLDILAQHLVSMAAAGEYTVEAALELIRGCTPYRNLTMETLTSVLCMLAGDDEHADDKPVSPRVEYDRIHGVVTGSNYSRMLAVSSGGTIPDRGMYAVYLEDRTTRLGELDEEFVFEARQGDKFLLGAFAWKIVSIERDRVLVRASSTEGAQSPFWRGDGIGRGYETGKMFGRMLREMEEMYAQGRLIRMLTKKTGSVTAAENTAHYLIEQIQANGCLATDQTLVMEYFEDESGDHQMMLHCPYGGRVNQGLAVLLRAEAAKRLHTDVRAWYDDDGVLLHVTGSEIPEDLLNSLKPDTVYDELWQEIPKTAQFTIAFRYNMYRALMMGVRPGGRVPLWVQRMRGAEALARACDYPAHPILQETMRDCMQRYIDTQSLMELLCEIRMGRIRIVTRRDGRSRPSPMTLSLRRQVEAEMMYAYAPVPEKTGRVTVVPGAEMTIKPAAEQLEEAHTGAKTPESAQGLHEKLMIEGDLMAEETESPFEWMNELLESGRVMYIEPGLWIAAEQRELYRQAMEEGTADALERIVRRCLRYRGPQNAEMLTERYDLPAEQIVRALDSLLSQGEVCCAEGVYIHAEVYRRAQRMTISLRRHSVKTAPPCAYASLLSEWQRESGSPKERLAASIRRLYGLYLPVEQWESVTLPARTSMYRPQMLDQLLSDGTAVWRLSEDGEKLAFFPADAVDWDADIPVRDQSDEAAVIRRILERRGASFLHSISAAANGMMVRGTLKRMAMKGDVVCDSFAPLRKEASTSSQKNRIRSHVAQTDGGRWELARPIVGYSLEERIDAAFDRWGIFCRETAAAEGVNFAEALNVLRQMEYTGLARRGYFVRTLSGAQFVRSGDFDRIQARLAYEDEACVCLNAVDPMQPWGRILKFQSDESERFLCVPGTAVVLRGGRVSLILERQGSVLRAPDGCTEACKALADAFRAGRIYPHLRFMCIKAYPREAGKWLEEAGFIREMLDYVLTKE